MEMCFADTNKNHQPIDIAIMRDGTYRGKYSNENLEEIQVRYTGAILMGFDEAYQAYTGSFIKPPVEIDEEKFFYWLEVLPPGGWERSEGSESFYVTERICGDITTHCVRIGGKYYQFDHPIMRSHNDRVRHVQGSLK